mmetsp:Transcript_61034/g.157388  ORF Transcript_61034/g.157388 Transcript_61034/m.157388 type:complete len:244 (+) Transcript_61034:1003-1734(+)
MRATSSLGLKRSPRATPARASEAKSRTPPTPTDASAAPMRARSPGAMSMRRSNTSLDTELKKFRSSSPRRDFVSSLLPLPVTSAHSAQAAVSFVRSVLRNLGMFPTSAAVSSFKNAPVRRASTSQSLATRSAIFIVSSFGSSVMTSFSIARRLSEETLLADWIRFLRSARSWAGPCTTGAEAGASEVLDTPSAAWPGRPAAPPPARAPPARCLAALSFAIWRMPSTEDASFVVLAGSGSGFGN